MRNCSHTNIIAVLTNGLRTLRSSVFLSFQTLALARPSALTAIWFAFSELSACAGVLDKYRTPHFFQHSNSTLHYNNFFRTAGEVLEHSHRVPVRHWCFRGARVILHIFSTHVHQKQTIVPAYTPRKNLPLCIQSRTPLVLFVLT